MGVVPSTTSRTPSVVSLTLPAPAADAGAGQPAAATALRQQNTIKTHQRSQRLRYQPIHLLEGETEAQAHGAEPGVGVSDSTAPALLT